jgi:predicted lipid-binding transport protein (Tim44 family)
MRRIPVFAMVVLAALAVVGADTSEGARMGSGRSFGAQRQATPLPPRSPSVAPSNPATATPAIPPTAAAPAASGASRWLGPLAGLAAAVGLAALLSHFGLSEGFASILMVALLIFGGLFLIRMFLARRDVARAPTRYAGASVASGTSASVTIGANGLPLHDTPTGSVNRFEPFVGADRAVTPPVAGKFPEGFDPEPFVQQAKQQFRKLQAAYDAADRRTLADVLTPEMFGEIDKEIAERGKHAPTFVDALDATVLEVTTEDDRHWASVQFTGMLREDGAVLPKPFEEIWNLVKPVDGTSGWLLAGIRQLA